MELKKQPETELEYWETIEGLGGFIWRMNHDLSDGRIEDPTGGIDKDISDARTISDRLVRELGEKFGVIHPSDCPKMEIGQELPPAPEGKIYYWDWYKNMKAEVYKADYEKLICSACPFSEGVERMMSLGGVIPCSVFSGMIYRLLAPYACAMVRDDLWSTDRLYSEIQSQHGDDALTIFKTKEEELKSMVQ